MIIAISGKKGSGKSTLSDALRFPVYRKQICPDGCTMPTIRKFADPIYDVARALFPGLEKQDMTDLGITVGEFLQDFGTEYIRAKNPNFWVRHMANRLDDILGRSHFSEPVILIDDLRFKNEAAMLRERGAILVRLERTIKLDDCRKDTHQSEIDLDDWTDWDIIVPCGYDIAQTAIKVALSIQEVRDRTRVKIIFDAAKVGGVQL